MYKVVVEIKLKVQGIVKAFPTGSVIKLPETAARMFLQHGKIVPVFEPVDDFGDSRGKYSAGAVYAIRHELWDAGHSLEFAKEISLLGQWAIGL